jgi:O-antigen/teichoic acid export membrane protein
MQRTLPIHSACGKTPSTGNVMFRAADLKAHTIRGGFARLGAQGMYFLLRLGSLTVLARLLTPKDFGFVGMVTAFTGVLILFRDFGLSAAAVQQATVTEEQLSTLFWTNVLIGTLIGLITVAVAPAIAAFYHEPRLFAVTAVLAAGFLFNAAGIQHAAILQRCMRFTTLAMISVASLIAATAIGIGLAMAGCRYWALVAMSITAPLAATIGLWITAGWLPGMPRRRVGIRSMIRFGGTLTLNGVIAYVAYNAEKVMIGRLWGADAIGLYGRAYQLVNIPTENLNSAIGEVAFAALSRLQDDPVRLRSYFLKGFSLVLGLTLPITIACGLFADDIVFVVLGPKWKDAATIVRFLAPTIVIFAIINPLGWLLYSIGRVQRGLKIAVVFAPLMIAGYALGLPYGPKGVAFAYSAVMTLWVVPHVLWCVYRTPISFADIVLTASRPLASGIIAGACAFGIRVFCGRSVSPAVALALESGVLFTAFVGTLFIVAGQKSLYVDLLRGLTKPAVASRPDISGTATARST